MSSIFLREKIYLINNHSNKISGSKLPSNLQVLRTLFFNMRVVKLNLRESARLVIREVLIFWEKARIPVRLEKNCILKVESLYDEWRTLQKHAGRNTASHKEQEEHFISKYNDLFDIAHADALFMIKIETDKLFLINQRKKGRPGFMYGIDYKNMRKEKLSIDRNNKTLMKEKQSAQTEDESSSDLEMDQSSSDLDIDESSSSVEIDAGTTSSKRVRGQKTIITPKLVCALDNCKISDRGAIHIIIAVVEALGENVENFVINRTSIQRCRQILRKDRASLIKDKFQENELRAAVLHWDGKLLPNLVGKDIVDRLSIVISSGNIEKILAIPVLQNATANIKRLNLKESEIPEFVENKIEFFISSRTMDFFKLFNLDTEFLSNDPSKWSENLSYQNALQIVSNLRVVNDTAERGIKLIEDYNSILTTNEEQKQFVLQIVSDYKKIFPDCKKATLKKKL